MYKNRKKRTATGLDFLMLRGDIPESRKLVFYSTVVTKELATVLTQLYFLFTMAQQFRNVMLEKDGEDQLNRSCEKWRSVT